MPDIIERLWCAEESSLLVLITAARGNPLYQGYNLLISVSGHLASHLVSQPPCSGPENTTRRMRLMKELMRAHVSAFWVNQDRPCGISLYLDKFMACMFWESFLGAL